MCTKYEVSMLYNIHYENMKGKAKCRNCGSIGGYGASVTNHSMERVYMTSYPT